MEWQGQKAYAHIIQDITEKKQREQKLTAEAYHDSLTGIGNRYFLIEQMEKLLNSKRQLTFCYCDLDHLKYVNDTYGHLEGDWYICHFVHTMKKFIRKEDILARIGGDEFCLVLEGLRERLPVNGLSISRMPLTTQKKSHTPKGSASESSKFRPTMIN